MINGSKEGNVEEKKRKLTLRAVIEKQIFDRIKWSSNKLGILVSSFRSYFIWIRYCEEATISRAQKHIFVYYNEILTLN